MPPAKPPTVQRGLLLRVLVLLGQHDLLWKRKTGQGEPQAPHGPAPAPAVGAAGARPSATHLTPVPPTSPQCHPLTESAEEFTAQGCVSRVSLPVSLVHRGRIPNKPFPP